MTETNEHVRQTIEDLGLKIAELQQTQGVLIRLFGPPFRPVVVEAPEEETAAARDGKKMGGKKMKRDKGNEPRNTRNTRKGKAGLSLVEMFGSVLGRMARSFRVADILEAAVAKYPGAKKKLQQGAYYGMQRLVATKVCRQERKAGAWWYEVNHTASAPSEEGAGQVEKRKENGAGEVVENRKALMRPKRTRAAVEAELKTALQERDSQRAQGRETMAMIAQRKVDALAEELDERVF